MHVRKTVYVIGTEQTPILFFSDTGKFTSNIDDACAFLDEADALKQVARIGYPGMDIANVYEVTVSFSLPDGCIKPVIVDRC